MKLIALHNFRNVPALRLKDDGGKTTIENAVHDDTIHKGATFEIGRAKDLDEMRKTDRPNAEIVAQLFVSGCIGDATDVKIVKAVNDELAAEAKREEHFAKLNEAASLQAAGHAAVEAVRGRGHGKK
jgi:hypothetical protein